MTNLFRFAEIRKRVEEASDGQHDLPFEDVDGKGVSGEGPHRRLFEESRMLYRSDALDELPLGLVESLALPGESYELTLTSGLLETVYRRAEDGCGENLVPHAERILRRDGGYVDLDNDGRWWAPSGRVFYSPHDRDDSDVERAYAKAHFYTARRFRDPFGNTTMVHYDRHDLAPIETSDPVGNVVSARLDYRVLRPNR